MNEAPGPVYGLVADESVHALHAKGFYGPGGVNPMPVDSPDTVLVANTPRRKQEDSVLAWVIRGLVFGGAVFEVIEIEELGNLLHRKDSRRTVVGEAVADMEDLHEGGEALEIEGGLV
ncbi:hypothetical protein A6A40_03360 [Azospirillum humicireducens]|uniref:Uncharacterized protein n=1 Tax=Azospirillum humicireducens TaxID=1226968 RepID=A0A160JE76_9PROT|nr:hypothetical protein [Azospirillum humicireducens]ANC91016.1 hypothetical protein A6A40_03360 [Azospirillum humicireducens]